jgi:hypothetical protein
MTSHMAGHLIVSRFWTQDEVDVRRRCDIRSSNLEIGEIEAKAKCRKKEGGYLPLALAWHMSHF